MLLFSFVRVILCICLFVMAEIKKRGKRCTVDQMAAICDFIEQNRIIITGRCHPLQANELESTWDRLVNILNAMPGARKDKKQWKNFLAEWKSKTKKKARLAKQNLTRTGGGSYDCEQLSELEHRLLNIWGWVTVIGNEDLPEELDPDLQDISMAEIQSNASPTNENVEEVVILDNVVVHELGETNSREHNNKEEKRQPNVKTG